MSNFVQFDHTARGSELLLGMDRSSDTPMHVQLEGALRDAIRSGRFADGTKLPASRVLAAELSCSRWVVVEAYQQLTAEGYLQARAGGGTVVVSPPPPAGDIPRTPVPAPPAVLVDFEPGLPDLAAFPRSAWLRALQHTVRSLPHHDLNYGADAGVPLLRRVLSEHLARTRGVRTDADGVLVCAGVTHGLTLLCEVLRERGHRQVAVEDPGWPRLSKAVRRAGLTPVQVPVDEEGLVVDALWRTSARAVLASPAHQFPAGVVLSPSRRTALLDWARECDAVVFEDDYDAEYRYDRRPVGALQGLAPDRVAYLGTVSKTLGPGVGIGWLVAPRELRPALVGLRDCGDPVPATLDQMALAHLIESGSLDRHLRRTRSSYVERLNTLRTALAEHLPGARIQGVDAGLHLTLLLPDDADEAALVREARRLGVLAAGLGAYHSGTSPRPGLVIGYGKVRRRQITEGIAALAEAYRTTRRIGN
ncbi:PLP-dependent aminotransferase family protein [Streptomyces sp. V4I23]|uniref:MocR-like pyridoxine biosynthesis transcription factor PdxR n=1 Tax=Streptomyces sp. V4I23 TaxID=3042282 RepID=UPI0027D92FFA|nr:PLP-dependent aminotransferase family protein [Streptomyces sp. V4I23]